MNLLINKWLRKHFLLNKFTFSVCFSTTQESSTITSLLLYFYLKPGNYLTFFNDHTGKFHSTKLLSKNKFYLLSKSFTVTIMAQIVLEFIFSLTNNKSYFFEKCLLFVQTNIEFLVDVVPDDELEFECSVSRLSVVEELRILDFGLISSKLTPLVSGTNAKLNKKPKAAIMA